MRTILKIFLTFLLRLHDSSVERIELAACCTAACTNPFGILRREKSTILSYTTKYVLVPVGTWCQVLYNESERWNNIHFLVSPCVRTYVRTYVRIQIYIFEACMLLSFPDIARGFQTRPGGGCKTRKTESKTETKETVKHFNKFPYVWLQLAWDNTAIVDLAICWNWVSFLLFLGVYSI